jgi:hypothetical protein
MTTEQLLQFDLYRLLKQPTVSLNVVNPVL